ncbi:MAG: DUF1015 domain-containing protein [Desulfatibacillaceae bacterium]
MADIAPFPGIRYNPETVTDLSEVVAPPYDVIPPEQQQALYDKCDYNVVRLILNRDPDNPHARAAEAYRKWLNSGVLVREDEPALYLTATEFTVERTSHTRLGLISRVRLEPFDKGIVRPHEKTFSKVCTERFGLMSHSHANFSPVFSLFRDPGGDVFRELGSLADQSRPTTSFTDDKGHDHRLWVITDTAQQERLVNLLAPATLYIADGHHRYTTCLNYLNARLEQNPDLPEDHPARFTMMYLAGMSDPGLVILPAHRMLKRIPEDDRAAFPQKAEEFFDVTMYPLEGDGEAAAERLLADLEREGGKAIGVVMHGRKDLALISLKEGAMAERYGDELAPELRGLDVTVLTRLVFMDILGLTRQDLDDASLMGYETSAHAVIEKVLAGETLAGFILNPTRIDQVRAVAEAGLTMPRKSTYFYPKVTTGLVIHDLDAR